MFSHHQYVSQFHYILLRNIASHVLDTKNKSFMLTKAFFDQYALKTVTWNIITIQNIYIYSMYFKIIIVIYSYNGKAEFSVAISWADSVSHDPSEIILMCWFGAKETCYYRWWKDSSKEQHLFEIFKNLYGLFWSMHPFWIKIMNFSLEKIILLTPNFQTVCTEYPHCRECITYTQIIKYFFFIYVFDKVFSSDGLKAQFHEVKRGLDVL